MRYTQFNVRMPMDLRVRLDRYCAHYNTTAASFTREALTRELDLRGSPPPLRGVDSAPAPSEAAVSEGSGA